MLAGGDRSQEMGKWREEWNIRRGNAGKPLVRIASDPIPDDLLIMETSADDEGGKKSERGEDCVGGDNPTGGERDGGRLVVWHGGREQESCRPKSRTSSHFQP